MKTWAEVSEHPEFAALPAAEQEQARLQYFREVVAPKVRGDEVEAVRAQFDADTRIRKRDLPRGVQPSTAGAGRGSVNPPVAQPERTAQDGGGGGRFPFGSQIREGLGTVATAAGDAIKGLAGAAVDGAVQAVGSFAGATPAEEPAPLEVASQDTPAAPSRADLEFQSLSPAKQTQARQQALQQRTAPPEFTAPKKSMVDKLVQSAGGDDTTHGRVLRSAADLWVSGGQIVPQTLKIASDISQLVTEGGTKPLSDAMQQWSDALGGEQSQAMREKAGKLIYLTQLGNQQGVTQFLLDNPEFTINTVIPSVGSMAVGAGGASLGARASARGVQGAAEAAAARTAGAEAGAGAANMAMNAGQTFDETDASPEGRFFAALVAAGGTKLASRLTEGGAEAALARGGTRLSANSVADRIGRAGQTALREGAQEGVEQVSQDVGQQLAETGTVDPRALANNAASATVQGAVMGAGASVGVRPRGVALDNIHASLDQAAQRVGLGPKATSALRDAVVGMEPDEAYGFVTRALEGFERRGMVKKPGAVTEFKAALTDTIMQQRETAAKEAEKAAKAAETAKTTETDKTDKTPAPTEQSVQQLAQSVQDDEDYTGLAGPSAAPVPVQPEQGAPHDEVTPQRSEESKATVDEAAHEAASSPHNDLPEPTGAQKEAGNYKKGHYKLQGGLDISIETPKGGLRTSKEGDPEPWQVTMPVHYGYIKRTVGADGEQTDISVGPKGDNGRYWVINQTQPGSTKLDEHKIFTGVDSADEATDLYKRSFANGFGDKTFGSISGEFNVEQLKAKLPGMAKPVRVVGGIKPTPGALAAGQAVTLDGKPYTVKEAAPDLLRLTGPDGTVRVISKTSKNWAKVKPAAQRPATAAPPSADSGPQAPPEAATGPRIIGRLGRMPNTAEPVDLRPNKDGTLTPYQGKYAMTDYETDKPIVVPADATDDQAVEAIQKAGAAGSKDKWFGVQHDVPRITPQIQSTGTTEGAGNVASLAGDGKLQVRAPGGERVGVLPAVQGGVHEGVAKNAPHEPGAEGEGQRSQHGQRVPEEGKAGEATLPVRQPGSGDASRGLQQAAAGDVGVPPVPSEAARSGDAGGKGSARGDGGAGGRGGKGQETTAGARPEAAAGRLTPSDDARLKTDAGRQMLDAARADLGWAQKGGELIRDPRTAIDPNSPNAHREGDVVGRTPWIGSDLWRNRPTEGGKISEAEAHQAIDRALAGEPMTAKQKRFVQFALDREAERAWMPDEPAPELEGMDPAVREATDRLLADALARGLDIDALQEDAAKQTEGQSNRDYLKALEVLIANETLAGDGGRAARPDTGAAAASSGSRSEDHGPRGPPAEGEGQDDFLTELFGTPAEQEAAQARFMVRQRAKALDLAGVRDAIAAEAKRAKREYDGWLGRVYKANRTQIDLHGDGPSNQASMSVGAINESRRRKAMDALAQEITALGKLADAVTTDSGAERVLASLRDTMQKAERAVESGNWPDETADSMFESMLLDDLKFRGPGGQGNITSNGLSKALLAAFKDGARPNLTLQAETEADAKAKAQREAASLKAEKDADAESARRAKADAERPEFALTGSNRPADVAMAGGQVDLLAAPAEAPAPAPKPAPKPNTVFTEDAAEKARALLRSKLGMNKGPAGGQRGAIDPEVFQAGITLAGYHIERGARTFAAFARAMIEDLGDIVQPYLKSWYMAVKYDPRSAGMEGLDGAAAVEAADVDALAAEAQNQAHVPGTPADLERDSSGAAPAAPAVAQPVQGDGSAAGDRTAGGTPGSSRGGRPGNARVPAGSAPVGRELGDQPLHRANRADQPSLLDAGADDGERGDDPGIPGVQPEHVAADQVESAAVGRGDAAKRRLAQFDAEKIPVKPGLDNIRATLPYLLPEQQEDVHKAEQRFANPTGYGMLFTNGTGTGKTFTGLGIVKRFERQGKKNILIVVPDAKIMSDWVDSGRAMNLNITPLVDTKDAGKGVTITTYANMGMNDELARREWDLVVPDEVHSLMQAADGKDTLALDALRAITLHPRGVHTRFTMMNRPDIEERKRLSDQIDANNKIRNLDDTMDAQRASLAEENTKLQAEWLALDKKLEAIRKAVELYVDVRQGAQRPRVAGLSATPFAYETTVDWAEGLLFDYAEGYPKEYVNSGRYNTPSPHDYFFMQHFGWHMKNGKLNQPGAKVDRGLMQRQFNAWLKKRGVLSGRSLEVDADYDRRFILAESAIGNEIDRALDWLSEKTSEEDEAERARVKDGAEPSHNGYAFLNGEARDGFYGPLGHLVRRYFLEAIKAKEVVQHVREHLALGRKVVVWHDFKKGGSSNPFDFQPRTAPAPGSDQKDIPAAREAYNRAAAEFRAEFPMLTGDALLTDLISPIERFRAEFPDVLLINGDEKPADILARYKRFNDDAAGPLVALVQSAKNKGWSGHDTTGKHQRVQFNLGLPTQPTMTIQQEGRTYRTGQVSNAMFRYLNTGTDWEKWAFASTIAERASAAENLGSGELARALKDSFIIGFEESGDFPAGHEGEGTGGKARDKAANNAITEYDRAKTFYFGTQKKNSKTKAQEGKDYFATPEPVGLKMVQWLNLRGGEDALEPSAGHGAIARWFGETTKRTAIEPSNSLGARLAMVFDGKIIRDTFENLNVVNKFDGIAMNPPFGTAGRTAIDHLAKAATHLREGGRIVALIPTGPAADKRFDAWFYGEDQRKAQPLGETARAGRFYVGDIVALDGRTGAYVVEGRSEQGMVMLRRKDGNGGIPEGYRSHYIERVLQEGPRTEGFRPAEGLHMVADIKLPTVTFERAGTAVATRIVVLEKPGEGHTAPQQRNLDYSDLTSIGELFDTLEDVNLDPRVNPAKQADEVQTPREVRADVKAEAKAEKAAASAAGAQQAQATGMAVVEHTTAKGKVIKGVIRKDLTQAQAKEIDPYTWRKDGGFFIRLEHMPALLEKYPPGATPLLSQGRPFYSALARAVDAVAMEQGKPQSWLEFLKGMVANGRVKADEVEWSGVREWLQLQDGKISKQAIADYLAANGVQVSETVLTQTSQYILDINRALRDTDYTATINDDRESIGFADPDGEGIDFEDLPDAIKAKVTAIAPVDAQPTKYGNYTLPGGTNYREVLLTLPTTDLALQNEGDRIGRLANPTPAEVDTFRRANESNKAAAVYRSGHWSQPNVLAHIRVNDRTDADGKRVLFVEEIQSDWGQAGKKQGFGTKVLPPRFTVRDANGNVRGDFDTREQAQAYLDNPPEHMRHLFDHTASVREVKQEINGPPAAPFVGKTDAWVALALKRIVKMAVDEGYDRVAIVSGEQSAERYDLSKQIAKVRWDDASSGGVGDANLNEEDSWGILYAYDHDGNLKIDKQVDHKELPDLIGKELAERLLSAPAKKTRSSGGTGIRRRQLEGLDLKVGGEGMRAFYDKIVPSVAKDVLHKLGGGALATTNLERYPVTYRTESAAESKGPHTRDKTRIVVADDNGTGDRYWHGSGWSGRAALAMAMTPEEADAKVAELTRSQQKIQTSFDITPAMREQAANGVPLFKSAASTTGVDPRQLTVMVHNIRRGWDDSPPVTVVATTQDLPADKVAQLRSMGALGTVRGLIDADTGHVWLIADRQESLEDAQFTLFHEVLGHYGLRKVLGEQYGPELRLLRAINPALGAEARAWMQANGQNQTNARISRGMTREAAMAEVDLLSVEEALADRAGNPEPIKGWQKFMAVLQKWLRAHGMPGAAKWLEGKTQAETLALLQSARDAVEKQAEQVPGNSPLAFSGTPEPLLSQKHTPEQKEALARAGIGPRRRLRDHLLGGWDKAVAVLSDVNLRQDAFDQFRGIQRAIQRDVGNLPMEQDPYITARLANGGTTSVMRALLLHGQARWTGSGQHLEKIPGTEGLLDVLKPLGDDLQDFFGWMIGNRAARLMREGRENNFTPDQIKALQGLADTPEKLALFQTAAVKYAAFKRSVLDVGEGGGIINPESRAAWDHADYISFYRQIDERSTFSATGRKGLAGQSSGIRQLRGGESALNDPIENLLMNFSRLIDASLKNNALRHTIRELTAAGSPAIEKVGYTMTPEIIPRSQIEAELRAQGTPDHLLASMPAEAFEGMAKMWAIQPPTDPKVIRVMEGGRPQFYKVNDPLLLKAATSFVPFDFPGLAAFRMAKRILTATVTATPEFMLRNFLRDTLSLIGISPTWVNPLKSFQGVAKAFMESGAAEHMLFAGASFQSGNMNAADPTGTARAVRRALRQKGMDATAVDNFMGSIVDGPLRAWEMYRHLNESVENANREALFEAVHKKTGSITAAAYEAKDLMDFNLRGSHPVYQLAADVLPFFNARMQGLYRLARSDPKRIAVYGAIMATLSVLLTLRNIGEPWYDEIPDWEKDAYWHIKLYGQVYRIPKPFELGVLFATIPERAARYAKGEDSGQKFASRLLAAAHDQLAVDPVPQLIRPGMNVLNNWDNFRTRPIENEGDLNKLAHLRYAPYTSATAKAIARGTARVTDPLNISPKDIEYLVGGYLGTAGLYALALSDMAVRELEGYPPQPAPRLDDLPVVKAFIKESPARGTVFESDVYQVRKEVSEIYASVKALRKQGLDERADALEAKSGPQLEAHKVLDKTAERLSKIRKERNSVYADEKMTPKQKRAELDKLQTEENAIAKDAALDPRVKALR